MLNIDIFRLFFTRKPRETGLCDRCLYANLCEQCGKSFWKRHYTGQCKIQQICCASTSDLPILKERNVWKKLQGGGSALITSPDTPVFQIPPDLKYKPVHWWRGDEMIWLNT